DSCHGAHEGARHHDDCQSPTRQCTWFPVLMRTRVFTGCVPPPRHPHSLSRGTNSRLVPADAKYSLPRGTDRPKIPRAPTVQGIAHLTYEVRAVLAKQL